MTDILSDKKRRSLAVLYSRMSLDELERRIAEGRLAAPMQAVAQEIFDHRVEHGDIAPAPGGASHHDGEQGSILGTGMLLVAGAGLSWVVLPAHLAALVAMVAVCWAVPALGKGFPRLGLALGIMFALLPVGLSFWAWRSGALVMKGGDYKPLEAMLAWLVLGVMFLLFWSLASLLIFGSRHNGSWGDLHDRLKTMRDAQREALTRRR